MANLHQQQIIDKIQNITFKDGTFLNEVISDIIIKGNNIGFSIDISGKNKLEAEEIRLKAINELNNIKDVNNITIVFTQKKTIDKKAQKPKHFVENVKKIILVASGKGGVGKSTISALIAQQLSLENYQVGIVDADIYGPSIPHIFGINEIPKTVEGRIIPILAQNIQIISIGFFVKAHSAIIYRGPMASKIIYQLLSNTRWNNLDYLIIDMPPGTGDIHLSMLENYHLDGVIVVTTPQKISEIDVIRSIDLYRKLGLPILGIIENMIYMLESDRCGHLSKKYNIPLIAKIPIIPQIANACDKSLPLTNLLTLPLEKYL
ncbi:Mrp/NBP35 family ATP-binding protein [Rickettsia typhi]|uniref:Iron-sulfur cluster carrier protein n=2 Tax=Rickettsia typhi TaxID=785 RepID=APBC_RICTY|nr:Mrp/NBP35 family ATP-binding protein [Rickettsia typhi]Q68XP6.1 RecName: Full=Iron-sulfur cluster carrier protein [Rickettsia typhi str. Wilmington]AAU03596.1 ATP-binding protein Mrp [Rickettsia typhi str. Wilmington]AFE53975.1 ATP-binding protein Mrp [Rickettsia typhi str. TH1527]AFE54814.1 ATP-binding protein Mrp [Rickettsia typhi str. B9991CWPP]